MDLALPTAERDDEDEDEDEDDELKFFQESGSV